MQCNIIIMTIVGFRLSLDLDVEFKKKLKIIIVIICANIPFVSKITQSFFYAMTQI